MIDPWFAQHIRQDKHRRTGFTLLELLVVVAIIGILATVATISLNVTRAKGRDAIRVSALTEFRTALEFYYGDHGHYPGDLGGSSFYGFRYRMRQPNGTCSGGTPSLRFNNAASAGFLEELYAEGYLTIEEWQDPSQATCGTGSDAFNCPYNCRYVVLTAENPAPSSYLLHCRLERPDSIGDRDGGTAPLYFEVTGGNPTFCLVGHSDD